MFLEAFGPQVGWGGLCPAPHYGGRAGGTHPTGMHSCLDLGLESRFFKIAKNVGEVRMSGHSGVNYKLIVIS